mmetsp:Transcript_10321/g.30872  ORF Transcript_10321/g.30872 Transcript_10321/m.30872 type:complete len:210 (-) Transcript_10321:321-950(-)
MSSTTTTSSRTRWVPFPSLRYIPFHRLPNENASTRHPAPYMANLHLFPRNPNTRPFASLCWTWYPNPNATQPLTPSVTLALTQPKPHPNQKVGDTPMHRSLPEPFQPLVREMFLDYYDMYNLRIEESLHRDAQNMRDIFDAGRGKFRWRSLLVALEETKSLVEESLGDRLEDDDDDDNDEDDEDDEDDEEGGEQEEKAGGMAGGGKAVA